MAECEYTGDARYELQHPVYSTTTLIKASLFAVLLAGLVLVFAVLPAEYGIDPTGVGTAMGLLQLSGSGDSDVKQLRLPGRKDTINITVPAGLGLEYKLFLLQGDKFEYAWTSKGGELYFDFHGEPEGAPKGYFESYTISTNDDVRGSLTAPFTGTHGWYWKNEHNSPVVVTLQIGGRYKIGEPGADQH